MLFKKIFNFGDKLEDKVRGRLSHFPITYAFLGGAGVIIFWRGIWHSMDYAMSLMNSQNAELVTGYAWWDGPLSILIGMSLLLLIGLFVSSFIGNEILISGMNGEKKVAEKTEQEIKEDVALGVHMVHGMKELTARLESLEKKLSK
ncbi:MAG: hypothetical protein WC725_01390 [Patescibacteria group bacterium]|jgi:hypothetical protein